jgi:D-3-phosphoglycerate dehydrogenase
MKPTYYIFDFDSTFTQVEAMEELAEISLANDPEKELLIEKIKQLTDLAMDGSMPFNKSLKARIALLSAKKYHISMLVNRLRKRVSHSFARNKKFFKEEQGNIYIVSGGFMEFIVPIVKPYFINADHVFANTFIYDTKNNIIGADEQNFLAQDSGKVKLVKQLKLQGNVVVIGDGYTDYQLFEAGLAHKFYAYTENIVRSKVIERAEWIALSLDEILYTEKLPMSLSFPKTRLKAVLWGEETLLAEQQLKAEGYKIVKLPNKCSKVLLNQELHDAHLLLFSEFADLGKVNLKDSKLLTAGVWGEQASETISHKFAQSGVAIFGSEYAHTRSIAELALLLILQLNRNLGAELQGRKLGIVGYGHSGSMLSVMGEHLGMEVFYYDVDDKPALGNAKRVKHITELLKKCDTVVLSTGKNFGNEVLIGSKELKQMQAGAVLINLSYDISVDLKACEEALKKGKLAGFGMDFMNNHPPTKNWNEGNVILSYQSRLATRQVQQNTASMLSERMIGFINSGNTKGSLNFPTLNLPALVQSHRFIHIHSNQAGVLAQINGILAKHKINISGQYLKTDKHIGYVITDVSKQYSNKVLQDLKAIPETIKFRVLY